MGQRGSLTLPNNMVNQAMSDVENASMRGRRIDLLAADSSCSNRGVVVVFFILLSFSARGPSNGCSAVEVRRFKVRWSE
jgi:hypothetical protein